MKDILKYFLVLASALSLPSCNEDLDIMQDNKLSASNMWTTSTDVIQSTYGIYERMRSNFIQGYVNVFYWGEARVGDYMWGPSLESRVQDNNMITVRTSTMNSSTESTQWSKLYTTIDQANAVLKYADKVGMTESDKGFAIGQAAFARAYCYFWAARLWGDVPLNLVPIESVNQPETYPLRAPKADVYAQIGNDIETAVANSAYLGNDKYFATADAVNMLKAEYGLWMYTTQNGGDSFLNLASDALSAIGISSGKLLPKYSDVFSRDNKRNTEVVFALMNNQQEKLTGGYYSYFYHPSNLIASQYRNNPVPVSSTQWWSYSREFIDVLNKSKAEHNDSRVECNLGEGEYGASGQTLTWPNKFLGDMSKQPVVEDCDLLYYRYAYAGALSSLNIIAKRAYGVEDFYKIATRDAILEALVNEYFLEFPAEGVIWWPLIRLDKIWDYNPDLLAKKQKNPNILLWPISKSARNKNYKLTQTEGWD